MFVGMACVWGLFAMRRFIHSATSGQSQESWRVAQIVPVIHKAACGVFPKGMESTRLER
jgi:hypothetical protein